MTNQKKKTTPPQKVGRGETGQFSLVLDLNIKRNELSHQEYEKKKLF